MRDFHFLFAAWIAAWVIFFGYEISVGNRMARLRDEIEQLKKRIRGR